MTIKTILVHLDTQEHAADLVGVTATIAEAHGAHLIGLHVVPDPYLPVAVPPEAIADLIEAQRAADEARAAEVEVRFHQAAAGLRVPTEWRKDQARFETIADVVVRHGRTVDLLVQGQADSKLNIWNGADTAGEVMVEVGRPVLMVPLVGRSGPIGKRILVAWKDSHEASRAVFDAMPFLVEADMVYLLTVRQPLNKLSESEKNRVIPGTHIAATLAHHDVKCEIVERSSQDSSAGDEILAQVKALNCDMLVMGGYGHSRWREIIFGGATRKVFDEMTVPVLMSH